MTESQLRRLETLATRLIRLERIRQVRARQRVLVALAAIQVERDRGGRFAPGAATVRPEDMNRAYGTRRVVGALTRGMSAAERARMAAIAKAEGSRYE